MNKTSTWLLCSLFFAVQFSFASADLTDSVDARGIYFDDNAGNFELQNNLISAGDALWANATIYNQSTVAIEFDLTNVSSVSHTLQLYDSGGGGSNHMYNLYGYVGDGTVTTTDNLNTANLLATFATDVNSGFMQPPQYFIDVSAFINDRLNNGDQYAGFHIVAATSTSFEAFGVLAHLQSVPEPTSLMILACVCNALLFTRRRA